MANTYSRDILKVVIAQICQTIGWHTICTTPLEVLTDVLRRFIKELATNAHRYGEQFGHTNPSVADVTLAFRDLGINVTELEEYVEYVASVPCAVSVPKFPVERESHLNLLKPGSREVVTRPVHIHEHLPPMHPQLEEEDYLVKPLSVDITGSEPGTSPLSSPKNSIFKRPGDPVSIENNLLKRARLMEEEGRPLREISSVMMTTSGFLSPAREGKLPEARTPIQPRSRSRSSSPQPSGHSLSLSYPTVPPLVKGENKPKASRPSKPLAEGSRKTTDKDTAKTKGATSDPHTADDGEPNVKKLIQMKEMYKLKILKPKSHSPSNGASGGSGVKIKTNKHRNAPGISAAVSALPKIPKLSQSKNSKGEKSSISAPGVKGGNSEKLKEVNLIDGKLSSEPDKQKLNIFKKISKVKEEKSEPMDTIKGSLDSSNMDLENKQRDIRWAQTIESVIEKSREQPPASPEREVVDVESSDSELFSYDDDMSPPGTPSTPRTPDLIPPQKTRPYDKHADSKKKKKGKKDRKESKNRYALSPSPKRSKSESTESDYSLLEKPKTPEVESGRDESVSAPPRNREDVMSSHVFPFYPFPPGPGLIPPPLANPHHTLFNRFNLPTGVLSHPAMPNLPLPPTLVAHDTPTRAKKQPSLSPIPTTPIIPATPTTPSTPATPQTPDLPPPPPTPTLPPSKEKNTEKKKDKEHKKDKKDKIKKKKDKKEKIKNKEKGEKKKIKTGKKIKDKDKIKEKKEKKEKKKEKERDDKVGAVPEGAVPKLTLKLGAVSPQGAATADSTVISATTTVATTSTTHRKIVIKPVVDPEKEKEKERVVKEAARSPSPELARISALVTRSKPASTPANSLAHAVPSSPSPANNVARPSQPAPAKTKAKANQPDSEKKGQVAFYFDEKGNQVWICPSCGRQDDGSPMIGCDGCDAWYHWVCVGIQVPPDSNDWFCRECIAKRQDSANSDKKKKADRRKKKTGTT